MGSKPIVVQATSMDIEKCLANPSGSEYATLMGRTIENMLENAALIIEQVKNSICNSNLLSPAKKIDENGLVVLTKYMRR